MNNKPSSRSIPRFQIGDRVRIRHFGGQMGQITASSGPIGPGGKDVYRVVIGRGDRPDYIMLTEDQMDLVPRVDQAVPAVESSV